MSLDQRNPNELVSFLDDVEPIAASETQHSGIDMASRDTGNRWRILITDDEPDVHQATVFALRDTQILGRKLEFLHAYDSKEAVKVLAEVSDIAVILLDVVMETPSAGLDLVNEIRNRMKLHDTRIILRTGEPNQAPESKVIHDYDINDYKLKSDITHRGLYASLTAAVRSYKHICTIESSKKGLDKIIRSSSELMTTKGLHQFSEGVIVHMAALLGVPPEGVICVRKPSQDEPSAIIIAAAGDYCGLTNRPLEAMDQQLLQALLTESLDSRANVYDRLGVAVYLGSHERGDMSCFIANDQMISDVDKGLLEMFCGNISLCADNISFMEKLQSYAFTDSLLGLPNRNALEEIIDSHLNKQTSVPHSLALIDIDNFAEINAVLGQEYGDQLLRASADRLKNRFRAPTTVARVGGDTFAIYGPSSHIDRNRLLAPFANPFEINGEQQMLTVTAGVVPLFEIDGTGAGAIKDASIVLKQAKSGSRGDVIQYRKEMVTLARARLGMLKDLRAAFELNQLFLVFQPKLKLQDLSVTGFEALIRWRDSRGDFVAPAEFIPLAEQSGLIIRMGEWILRNAIAELALLRARGFDNLNMAVNLSVAQIEHPDFLDMLRRVAGESDIHPSYIELEITESIAMGDIEGNLKKLRAIRDLGFRLSMDDFGTGFSSLTYLQKMPINCLKIDRSFVNTSDTKSGRDIVEMIVHLGNTLGLNVIAEGVEEQEQSDLLKAMGCHEVQGYHYARPMARHDLHAWLAKKEGD